MSCDFDELRKTIKVHQEKTVDFENKGYKFVPFVEWTKYPEFDIEQIENMLMETLTSMYEYAKLKASTDIENDDFHYFRAIQCIEEDFKDKALYEHNTPFNIALRENYSLKDNEKAFNFEIYNREDNKVLLTADVTFNFYGNCFCEINKEREKIFNDNNYSILKNEKIDKVLNDIIITVSDYKEQIEADIQAKAGVLVTKLNNEIYEMDKTITEENGYDYER